MNKICGFIVRVLVGAPCDLLYERRYDALHKRALLLECERIINPFLQLGKFDLAEMALREIEAVLELAEVHGVKEEVVFHLQKGELALAQEAVADALALQKKAARRLRIVT